MQENQTGCRLVSGWIEIDLRSFAIAIGNIEKRLAAGAQLFGQLVSFGDQRRAVLYRRIVVIGGVALGLRKRSPVQPGIESVILCRRDFSHAHTPAEGQSVYCYSSRSATITSILAQVNAAIERTINDQECLGSEG